MIAWGHAPICVACWSLLSLCQQLTCAVGLTCGTFSGSLCPFHPDHCLKSPQILIRDQLFSAHPILRYRPPAPLAFFFGGGLVFFEDRVSLCVAPAVLELALQTRGGLTVTETCLPLHPSAGIKGVCNHRPAACSPCKKGFGFCPKNFDAIGSREVRKARSHGEQTREGGEARALRGQLRGVTKSLEPSNIWKTGFYV